MPISHERPSGGGGGRLDTKRPGAAEGRVAVLVVLEAAVVRDEVVVGGAGVAMIIHTVVKEYHMRIYSRTSDTMFRLLWPMDSY